MIDSCGSPELVSSLLQSESGDGHAMLRQMFIAGRAARVYDVNE